MYIYCFLVFLFLSSDHRPLQQHFHLAPEGSAWRLTAAQQAILTRW